MGEPTPTSVREGPTYQVEKPSSCFLVASYSSVKSTDWKNLGQNSREKSTLTLTVKRKPKMTLKLDLSLSLSLSLSPIPILILSPNLNLTLTSNL